MPSSSNRPNVVVFLTDQQRWDSMGSHGNPLDLTPNLDRLAARGTLVDKAFTCQPVCGPARSVLQTGCYPNVNGVHTNGIRLWDGPTLAQDFTAAGYDTAYIGKWHLASTRTAVPAELRGGYDYWLGADAVEFVSDAYDAKLYDNDDQPTRLPGYRSDAFIDAAIDYLARPHERPFLLFVSILEPHHQNARDDYPAPDGYRERYEGRWMPADLQALGGNAAQSLGGYWGMIKRIDEGFGRLLDAVRTEGLSDNTVVAFTSDHGCHFKTRNAEYKRSEHEASIRIPMVLAGPGFDGGGRIQDMVSLIDLPPTLLDAAGIDVPERMQGRSIIPLVNRDNTGWPDDVFVQISESCVGRAIRTRDYKYAVIADGVPGNQPGSDTYTEATLYDLTADPHELTNLIGRESFAEVAASLRERLLRRMVAAGETAPTIIPAPALPPGGQRAPRSMDRSRS
ncbi:MAG TPA: sulfatase-like hydrolase/transferase [Mycobacteriales bacterium]|nr:sulfatase-like hydrolase/transferase [Mycobacteriales bacterium]